MRSALHVLLAVLLVLAQTTAVAAGARAATASDVDCGCCAPPEVAAADSPGCCCAPDPAPAVSDDACGCAAAPAHAPVPVPLVAPPGAPVEIDHARVLLPWSLAGVDDVACDVALRAGPRARAHAPPLPPDPGPLRYARFERYLI